MAIAAIALGSNLGDREATLRHAVEALRTHGEVIAVSSFVDTEPVGYADQPRFLNATLLLETALPPQALLHVLLAIEQDHGRDRGHGIAKGPRTLDLDLLLHGDTILSSADLTLPHPEMHRRRFVLEPLAQIAPHALHPVLGRTIVDLLRGCPE